MLIKQDDYTRRDKPHQVKNVKKKKDTSDICRGLRLP